MPVSVQQLPIPDVGVGAGPWASAWIPGTLSSLTRAGMALATNPADLVMLLVSAIGAPDPIDATNPNQVGYFYGGDGSVSAPEIGLQAAAFYAIVRYPPPAGTKGPTVGAHFELQGSS